METKHGICYTCRHSDLVRMSEVEDWIYRGTCWECDLKESKRLQKVVWGLGVVCGVLIVILTVLLIP